MKVTVMKSAEVEVIEDILCNCCGEKIRKTREGFEDYADFDKQWGYFSDMDGERHRFDLCQGCYKEIVGGFKLPPTM